MGREIRRVPAGWEHPQQQPMFDEPFQVAFDRWIKNWELWQKGEAEYQDDDSPRDAESFYQWKGQPPDPDYYRPAWEEAPCYQVYETVSEGTPTSPVFDNLHDLVEWLVEQGHSVLAAEQFIEHGSAPSFIVTGGVLHSGIDAMGLL